MSEELAVGAAGAGTEEVKVNAEVSQDAKPEGGAADPQANANEGESEHKRKGGWQRKIEKLERENEFWREQALKGPKAAAPVVEQPKPEVKAKPTPKDFDLGDGTYDVEKFAEAVADWKVDQKLAEADKKREESQKAEKAKSEQQKALDSWHKNQGAAARKEYADFDDAIGSAEVEASPLMHEAIMTSEFGGHLAYYFATHEDEALAITRMNSYQQSKAIAKIEAQFAKPDPETEEESKETPEPPKPKAPAPPTPISKPSPSAKPFDPVRDADLPYKEWVKKRDAQLRKQ